MEKNINDTFLTLVRLGVGYPPKNSIKEIEWNAMYELGKKHGLLAIVLDGANKLDSIGTKVLNIPIDLKLQWIGEVLQGENMYGIQQSTSEKMATLFHDNNIRTYVLKGLVVSECYPHPKHRLSVDVDCFLLPEKSNFDAWVLGNDLIKKEGYIVEDIHYKNSTFFLSEIIVENHRYITPFRGNKKMKNLELILQGMIGGDMIESLSDNNKKEVESRRIKGTWLYRPPVMTTALFLIEHAYTHFLHEGLTWKHVLDWMMFSKKNRNKILWADFHALIDEFGFRKFYDSYYKLGRLLLGEIQEDELTRNDKLMMADVWDDLDLHKTAIGLRGKLYLAGNTIRAWWKYHYFSDISMPHALLIQTSGFLFNRRPRLD